MRGPTQLDFSNSKSTRQTYDILSVTGTDPTYIIVTNSFNQLSPRRENECMINWALQISQPLQ